MTRPIRETIKGLRQRRRANGSWRVWWEPTAAEKALGFEPTDLDAARPTWSIRRAEAINADVRRALAGDGRAARDARRSTGGRTIDALIDDYRRSRFFRDLRPATRRSYAGNLQAIGRKWGRALATDFTKAVINKWYETLLAHSGDYQAKALVRMMSILMSHAEMIGWRAEQSNPCFRLQLRAGAKRHRYATWAEFDALLAAADTLGMPSMACAIALSTLHAQRQTDVIGARIDAFRDMTPPHGIGHNGGPVFCWELVRSKRSNYGVVPVHPEAVNRVRNLIAAAPAGQELLLTDHATGQPYGGDLFRKRWTAIRAHAARACPSLTARGDALQFRDLRRTFGVWARAGGASKGDVGDVLGNAAGQNPTLGETYMPVSYQTAARAIGAVQRPAKKEGKTA